MPEPDTSRQSFLGPLLEPALKNARIAIIGLSGGGSHVVQQLAHIGFENLYLFDPDVIEETNLTRLVGATAEDVVNCRPKVVIAERVIRAVNPNSTVRAFQDKWQERTEHLRCADIILGCIDSFLCRRDLELFARRYGLPYIDVGMGVDPVGEAYRMYGQAVLSIPGGPCFSCLRLLTPDNLAREGRRYGSAGMRPQVVWANGVLASTAVGMLMDLLTAWGGRHSAFPFASFDGNTGGVTHDPRSVYAQPACQHFSGVELGDPRTMRL